MTRRARPSLEARATAASVVGCQHVVMGNGAPCQDAARTHIDEERGLIVLAVADGHGDAQYTHSDEGARVATHVAIDVLTTLLADTNELTEEAIAHAKRRLVFEWNRRVKHHARMVAARDGLALLWPDEVTGDWDEKVKVYGTTLVAVAITASHLTWLRIGDGEAILATSTDQEPSASRIFPAADKSMGQATYSLSMRSAIEHIDVKTARLDDHASDRLVVLATDGVADQYDADPTFEDEWGAKMLARITAKSWNDVMIDLPRYLGTVARDGDDCSVAMAWLPKETASS